MPPARQPSRGELGSLLEDRRHNSHSVTESRQRWERGTLPPDVELANGLLETTKRVTDRL